MNEKDWSEIWNSKIFLLLNKIFHLFLWRDYLKFFKHLKLSSKSSIIEIGCGTGDNSLKISKIYGCKTTLVDNCKLILDIARKKFKINNVKARFILKDVFELDTKKNYDFVFSEGLVEHFDGLEREKIFNIHKKLIKKKGHILILAPHSSFLYKFGKKILDKLVQLKFEEVPFSKKEILKLCYKNKLRPIKISKLFFGIWIGVLAQKF